MQIYPKTDHYTLYSAVWDNLLKGRCIGIFPEGGSHDRTELLPLKAGVSIMALGARYQTALLPSLTFSLPPPHTNELYLIEFIS